MPAGKISRGVAIAGFLVVALAASWTLPGATGRAFGAVGSVGAVATQPADAPAPGIQPSAVAPLPVPLTSRLTGVIGMALILVVGVLASSNRRRIRWKTVGWGLGL